MHGRVADDGANLETVLFDFGGTLDADGVAWKERFYSLYRSEGLDMTADVFAPTFFAADDPLVGGLPRSSGLSETVNACANIEEELVHRNVGCTWMTIARRLTSCVWHGSSRRNRGRCAGPSAGVVQGFR